MRRVICSLALVGIFVTVLAAPANAVKPDRFEPGPNPDLVSRASARSRSCCTMS